MTSDPTPIAPPVTTKRGRASLRYPTYDLVDCVAVAKAIHERGGGAASDAQLAAFLGYKSAANGAYLARTAGARLFGLIAGRGAQLGITHLAQRVLMPIYPAQTQEALVEAFFNVPLYKALYEQYYGKELPPEFGLKNALRTQYQVPAGRVDRAYRAFVDSAEQAGFFSVRGSRSQLIIPVVEASRGRLGDTGDQASGEPRSGDGGDDGGASGDGPQTPTRATGTTLDDLRAEYVSTLIDLFRERSAQGELDKELMERIENLLSERVERA